MITFLKYYGSLRLKMLYRSLGSWRKFYGLVILTMLLLGFYHLYSEVEFDTQKTWLAIGGIMVLLIQYHISRKDIDFLKTHTDDKTVYIILSCEYFLLLLPVLTLLLLKMKLISLILIAIPFLLPFLPRKAKISKSTFSIFGEGNVEWNSGFRMYRFIHFIVLILFIASCIYQVNFNLSLLLMAINMIVFCAYYNIYESDQMIIKFRNPKELLQSKIKFFSKYVLIVGAIFTMLLSLSYQNFSPFTLMIIGQVWILMFTILVAKYAFYPNKLAGEMQTTILALICMIPFLAPFSLIIGGYYYGVAKKRLSSYYLT